MFKYDTHTHSSEASACATNDISKMIDKYIELGYSGIILTNHFFNGNTCIPKKLGWEKQVEHFCLPYEKAEKICNKRPFDVFFGWEYNYLGTEFLTYGLDKSFLLNHPEILSLSLIDYAKLVHDNGGILVHAHPFREAFYIDEIRLVPEITDAVEVINGAQFLMDYNEKADKYSQKYNLPKTAGSDSHSVNHQKFCGMVFDHRLKDINDFINSILHSQTSLFIL